MAPAAFVDQDLFLFGPRVGEGDWAVDWPRRDDDAGHEREEGERKRVQAKGERVPDRLENGGWGSLSCKKFHKELASQSQCIMLVTKQ